jgi:two-component system, LytTR family, response regulator
MKYRCLLVDDEPLALKVLENHIQQLPGLSVIASCHNALDAMQCLQQHVIDLMFLDIQMPRLLGTSFLRTLRNPPKVIFTTAYKEYAVEAFELDAIDYLLKPVSLERLIKALNKLNKEPLIEEPEAQPIVEEEGFVYVRANRKMVKVKYSEILYIESMKDYVRIMLKQNKPLLVKQSITSMKEMLPANLFIRIHRSYIVAVQNVTAFTNQDVEIGGTEIPIGRLYSQHISKLKQS